MNSINLSCLFAVLRNWDDQFQLIFGRIIFEVVVDSWTLRESRKEPGVFYWCDERSGRLGIVGPISTWGIHRAQKSASIRCAHVAAVLPVEFPVVKMAWR